MAFFTSLRSNLHGILIFAGLGLAGCGSSEQQSGPTPQKAEAVPGSAGSGDGADAGGSGHASLNPAVKYLPKITVDEFNPDVTEALRADPHPRRGGKLRIRTPADYQHLNRLTVSGQPEVVILNQMADSLVDQDQETLEYYPEMAWYWKETDIVKKKSGEPVEGRIIGQTADAVTFVPGAWKITYAKCDLDEIDADNHVVVLKEDMGGARVEGRLLALDYTVRIDEGLDSPKAAQQEIIPIAELDTWENSIGKKVESRPFAKPNTAFEFHIRSGVTWHDGAPFTGEDVKFSFETIMNSTVDAQRVRNYYEDVSLCEVSEDGLTVHFQYRRPYFKALEFLAGVIDANYFIPKHIFKPEQFGGDEKAFGEAFNGHLFREKPVYTGPYRLKEWKRGDYLTIERDPTYWKNKIPEDRLVKWRHDQPYLDEITWVLYRDIGAVVKDLQNGALDVDVDVEPSTWVQPETKTAEFTARMVRAEQINLGYTYIGWNLTSPLFRDPEVRRALAMLIPREEINQGVYQGLAIPVTGPFFMNGPGYDPSLKQIDYDPEGAKRILTRAGWLDRDNDGVLEKEIDGKVIPFRFRYAIHNARDYHQKVADVIKERLEQAKLQVTIIKSDWSIYADTIRNKNFDATRFASSSPLEPDPFQVWHSSQIENNGDNFFSYRNARVDELCEKLRETMDPEERWAMAKEVHQQIYKDQPVCFLECFKATYFLHRRLRGIKLYVSEYPHNFTEWWWSEIPQNRQ